MAAFARMMKDYESIHQHPANRLIHAIGIPAILIAVFGLCMQAHWPGVRVAHSGWLLLFLTSAITTRWSIRAGLAYSLLAGACFWSASALLAVLNDAYQLGAFSGLFVTGWLVQLLGHAFEGQSPQFVSRPANLLLGPISLASELFPFIGSVKERSI
jgi:uncharacterized membrane protein YGL010W